MANREYLFSTCLGLMMLVISFQPVPVGGDVTLRATASQSHPMEGHSTQLTCEVRSMNQSQVIVWSKDQKSITWGDTMGQMMSSRFELAMNSMSGNRTSYTLTINDISRDDDGRYQCQVLQVNGHGYSAMASETVVLSVLYFPNRAFPYCSMNGSQTLLTGTEWKVKCTSEVGNPQISSLWTVADGAAAPLNFHTAESSSMVVSELELVASQDMQGVTYVCRVTSPVYADYDRTCSLGPLRILDWPIVTITRSVSRASEGTDVHFLCNTEPQMPNLQWVTHPDIDPERLVVTDDGLVLTVKNVRAGDNTTEVVCQVPYRDTHVEARSVILLDQSTDNHDWIDPSTHPFHPTSEMCMPWFGAFIFAVVVNLILCIIIVRLLVKNKNLSSKLRRKSGTESLKGIEAEIMKPKKRNTILTWPSGSSNWSMRSETQLQDQRHRSWQYIPPSDDGNDVATPEPRTYTELSPDTMDRAKAQRKRTRKAVSLPRMGLNDSDSYVTPDTCSKSTKAPQKSTEASRKSGLSSVQFRASKTPTSKSASRQRKGGIETISGRVSTGQPIAVEMDSYMPLNENKIETPPQKSTYQALQKAPNSSRSASKPVMTSLKKKLSSVKTDEVDKGEMTGDSGIYGENGAYMKHAEGDMSSAKAKQGSIMGESATYMPTGTTQSRHNSASINSSGTLSSESGADAHLGPNPSETPAYSTGATNYDMGEAIYAKSTSIKAGGKYLPRSQNRATMSSRAPMPKPTSGHRDGDQPSTDESYKEPYFHKTEHTPTYFTLEPDQGEYHNYGADISSESDSYQGTGTCDWHPANKAGSKKVAPARQVSSASDASYLELGDADGEIKGYMDMTKTKAVQSKASAKAAAQASQPDSEGSSNEYYLPMEGASRDYEYSIPPSNKLQSVTEESNFNEVVAGANKSKKKASRVVEHQQKKKGGWGLFKR